MVGDPSTDPFIRWSVDGNSFLVEDHEEFARLILPRFYKHNTFASFVRQLNMYDFHKVPHLQQGVLLTCNNNPNVEIWEFSSPNFQRSRPDLLILVTRKRNRDRQEGNADPVNLSALVKEITAIKKHQTNITADLRNLHRDNEIIWHETLAAREKHQKHQQVISKILQFLTAVFSNDHTMLTHLTSEEEAANSNQQDQQPAVASSKHHHHHGHKHTHSNSIKGLSKFISQCNVSSSNRDSSCDSALGSSDSAVGSSDSGVNSSDSGNSSGNGSGSDGDEEPKPAASKTQKPVDATMHKADSPESAPSFTNNQVDRKQKGKSCASPVNSVAVAEQPSNLDHNMGQPAARSAQAITDDIDQLQVNVETLAAQLGIDPTQFTGDYWTDLGGFSENYNGMINSASRADKRRLFDLADGKKKARHHPFLPQQQPPEYLSVPQQHNGMYPSSAALSPYMLEQHTSRNQDAYLPNDYTSPTDQLSNNHDFSFQLGNLLKSVDSTLKHHSEEGGAVPAAVSSGKETKAGYHSIDPNSIHAAPVPSNVASSSSFSPHHQSQLPIRNSTSSSDPYNTYYNDNTLIYTTPNKKTTLQHAPSSFASVSPQNQHLYFRPDQAQQQHAIVKNATIQNESKQVPHTTPYYVDPASIIPPQSQQQQQHLHKQPPSLYHANSFSCSPQQVPPPLPQSAMYAHQRRASVNPVETSFLADPSTMEKTDRTAYCQFSL